MLDVLIPIMNTTDRIGSKVNAVHDVKLAEACVAVAAVSKVNAEACIKLAGEGDVNAVASVRLAMEYKVNAVVSVGFAVEDDKFPVCN